jgi:hypothetical protein
LPAAVILNSFDPYLTYDGQPFYTVSIMEFRGVKVAYETQYLADPFEPSEGRKKWPKIWTAGRVKKVPKGRSRVWAVAFVELPVGHAGGSEPHAQR